MSHYDLTSALRPEPDAILTLFSDRACLEATPVNRLMDLFVV